MNEVIFTGGQVLGMLMRFTAAQWKEAAEAPGLWPEYREHLLALAKLRDMLTPAGRQASGRGLMADTVQGRAALDQTMALHSPQLLAERPAVPSCAAVVGENMPIADAVFPQILEERDGLADEYDDFIVVRPVPALVAPDHQYAALPVNIGPEQFADFAETAGSQAEESDDALEGFICAVADLERWWFYYNIRLQRE